MSDVDGQFRTLKCEFCGEPFKCFVGSNLRCWCMDLENISIDKNISDCICFKCLNAKK